MKIEKPIDQVPAEEVVEEVVVAIVDQNLSQDEQQNENPQEQVGKSMQLILKTCNFLQRSPPTVTRWVAVRGLGAHRYFPNFPLLITFASQPSRVESKSAGNFSW